jgi:hypothetical protein
MNTSSPLSKDQRVKKLTAPPLAKFPKEKFPIGIGIAKKILKSSEANIGAVEMRWLNSYMENRIQGECLPRSFLSNELPSEIIRIYGIGADKFIEKIVYDFKQQCGHYNLPEASVSN